MKPRVLLTLPIDPVGMAILEPVADVVIAPDTRPGTIRALARDAAAISVRVNLPPDIFDHAPRLLGCMRHGVGLDMIPVEAATAHGVIVANVPGANSGTVAEYVIAQMLLAARRLHLVDRDLRAKDWFPARTHADAATELAGKTVGVVGVGAIGTRVAEIAHHGFRMRVLGHQRRLDRLPKFVEGVALDDLFAASDYVVLACPLTPQTRGLANAARIARMKPAAVLVNVSRGPVVEEQALVAALVAKRIGGAALDVFETQPLARDHPLLGLDNVTLSPHMAGLSIDSMTVMSRVSAEDTVRILRGEKPVNFCNPEVWERALVRRRALG